jgi:hypothetical protein
VCPPATHVEALASGIVARLDQALEAQVRPNRTAAFTENGKTSSALTNQPTSCGDRRFDAERLRELGSQSWWQIPKGSALHPKIEKFLMTAPS